MIQIENTLVSLDIIEKKFSCDLDTCLGFCCIEGDSGAPLEEEEKDELRVNYDKFKPYMKPQGVKVIEEVGFSVIDSDGDLVTPLIDNKECAYAIEENGTCWCAIEKAWFNGDSEFRKPISCHLYPIRITKYTDFEAVNYNEWKICNCAVTKGHKDGIPLYVFLKEALITKYGEEWYAQLCIAAEEVLSGNLKF